MLFCWIVGTKNSKHHLLWSSFRSVLHQDSLQRQLHTILLKHSYDSILFWDPCIMMNFYLKYHFAYHFCLDSWESKLRSNNIYLRPSKRKSSRFRKAPFYILSELFFSTRNFMYMYFHFCYSHIWFWTLLFHQS